MGLKLQNLTAIFSFLVVSSLYSQPLSIDNIEIITEEYPPYNYTENGTLKGISVELMDKVMKHMGAKKTVNDIKVYPWSRGYTLAQKQKNTMLFSTTRTEERENLFQWVGPINSTKIALVGKKNKNIKVSTIADMKRYKIGVIKEDIGELLLLSKGLKKEELNGLNDAKLVVKMLVSDRIDMWAYESNVAKWFIKNGGNNPDEYEEIYVLKESELYYTFHKDTPKEFINKCQKSLEEVKAAH